MPRGDGTGPAGLGPMTGRATGYCAGYSVPGYMNPIAGGGFYGRPYSGRGGYGGRGRGHRNWFNIAGLAGWQRAQVGFPAWGGYANPNYAAALGEIAPNEEARMLKEQSKAVQQELNAINERIKELEAISKKR